MGLADACEQATEQITAMARALADVAARPVRVDVVETASSASDRARADAIKRGQAPEELAALREALGR